MKALIINSVCGIKSTGRICIDIAKELENQGYEVKIAYGREAYVPEQYKKYAVRIGNDWDVRFHALKARLFDASGFGSRKATGDFLKWADDYKPDLLWLHNIHGYYININLLFNWIKRHPEMEVKWTLHDCWAFTGHCTHFSYINCEKWKKECYDCEQINRYPKSLFLDKSKENYGEKKRLFTGINNMEIITPSNWLACLVKQSFLNEYKITTKYNLVDKTVFKPTQSCFRKEHDIGDHQIMVLGVASNWNDRKGFDDFIKLSKLLNNEYVIVIVGLDKKQIHQIPRNIIGIERTNNINKLVEIYSAADVFVNPSVEETFGLTTLEAISCGTPAVVYKNTACEEIAKQNGGYAVERSPEHIKEAIYFLFEKSAGA